MCNCIKEINDQLASSGTNTVLNVPARMVLATGERRPDRVLIATAKADSGKRAGPVKMFGGFCPFCGQAYEDGEETAV